MKKKNFSLKGKKRTVLILILAFYLGWAMKTPNQKKAGDKEVIKHTQSEKKIIWTCSMHPSIKRDKPGKCPICFMPLVEVDVGGSASTDSDMPQLQMSEYARKLAKIETTPVKRKFVYKTIELVGKLDYDETEVVNVTAWSPGRIDRMFVDYKGIAVKKGDHLVWFYSPELISAQEEYIQALKGLENLKNSDSEIIKKTSILNVSATRDKLRLYGVDENTINKIKQSKKIMEKLTIYSPVSGVVIEKKLLEGDYVKTGTVIYRLSNLEHLWLFLDVYETDIRWLKYGQNVEFDVEAYPGMSFEGKISFISPILDKNTRAIKVRVNVDNTQGLLKPEMLVNARIYAKFDSGLNLIADNLTDKWICPMHPDVIKDEQGECDKCGMDLVSTKSLGYAASDTTQTPPLVIPLTAPLITGKRAVVYVETTDGEDGEITYEGREIVLGPKSDDYYVVTSGLKEGDLVVTEGNFKIDSALQIQAKKSMMSMNDESFSNTNVPSVRKSKNDVPEWFAGKFLPNYLDLQSALASDSFTKGMDALDAILKQLHNVYDSEDKVWDDYRDSLLHIIHQAKEVKDITALRIQFSELSNQVKGIYETYGDLIKSNNEIYLYFCPMAFDKKGAFWIQSGVDVKNPFFGNKMLKCGEKKAGWGRGNK